MVLEGVVVLSSAGGCNGTAAAAATAACGVRGSGHLKHARGGGEEELKGAKMARNGVVSPFLLAGYGHGGEHMLSFDGCGGIMQGGMGRSRGPFTPFQWMELEHQAMIYKHLAANSPVPPNLIDPIRRGLASPYSSPAAFYGSASLGWGSYHIGYSGSNDPEPGRCRRTDGKKWRCSRDAVSDQKYCERHLNRGRNRSRKHVEGQSGHTAKGSSAAAAGVVAAAVQSPGGGSAGDPSGILTTAQQPTVIFRTTSAEPSVQFNSNMTGKENAYGCVEDPLSLSMLASVNPSSVGTLFSITNQSTSFEDSESRSNFGIAPNSSIASSPKNMAGDIDFFDASGLSGPTSRNTLQYFMDGCGKGCSSGANLSWSEAEDGYVKRTQLSISMPMVSSDLSSSSTSPIHGKVAASPSRLMRDFSAVILSDEPSQEGNWVPMFQEASMNGPLGEVLTKNSNAPTAQSKDCSFASLNLLTDGWDTSPRMGSPTDVLQKASLGSVSSSTGSSPRLESYRIYDGTGIVRDDLSSIFPSVRSSS